MTSWFREGFYHLLACVTMTANSFGEMKMAIWMAVRDYALKPSISCVYGSLHDCI